MNIEAKRQVLRECLQVMKSEPGFDARKFISPFENVSSIPEGALNVILGIDPDDGISLPAPTAPYRQSLRARGWEARHGKPRRVVRHLRRAA